MSSVYSLAYLALVMVLILAYTRHYQSKKTRALQNTAQFYEYNFPQTIYDTISNSETRNVKLEKAALIALGSESITRTLKVQESKMPIASLSQSGLIGDELFKRFMGSEVLMRQEIQKMAASAEKLQPGWAQSVLGASQEVAQNNALRKRMAQLSVFEDEYRSFCGNKKIAN